MIQALQSELSINVIASIIASVFFIAAGFLLENTRNGAANLGEIWRNTIFIRSQSVARISANSV